MWEIIHTGFSHDAWQYTSQHQRHGSDGQPIFALHAAHITKAAELQNEIPLAASFLR
jgi:hypothetical protein